METMKIYGNEYSRTKIKNNIMQVFELSGREMDWYKKANELAVHLSLNNQLTIAQCAGIIASLSPQKSWEANQLLAFDFIEHDYRGGHCGAFIDKAVRITETTDIQEIAEILNGKKITNFYWNILNPIGSEYVTIDRHALGIALNGSNRKSMPKLAMTGNQYEFIKDCYKWTADGLDILPCELQATTWVTYRELN